MNAPVNDGPRTLLEKLMAGSEPIRIAAAPVVKVTEVVGWLSDAGPYEPSLLVADNVGLLKFADVMPETEGKRGRFKVVVSFEEE